MSDRISRMWTVEDFTFKEELGKGKFGTVYKALASCRELAIKVIKKLDIRSYEFYAQTKHEVEIHSRLVHLNIVRLYGYFHDERNVYLVYELMPHGTLYDYLKQNGRMLEKQVRHIIRQLVEVLGYLASFKVLHRDLKLENILVDDLDSLSVKVSDFSWCCFEVEGLRTVCGTVDYLTPEMIDKKQYNSKVDVWSVGIIAYELTFGVNPFRGSCDDQTIKNIKHKEIEYKEAYCSPGFRDFINGCLQKRAENRFDIQQLREHIWIKE